MNRKKNVVRKQKRNIKERPLITEVAELRSCVRAEVAVLGSPLPIVLKVSVDVKQH